MNKKYKIPLICIFLLLLICISLLMYKKFIYDKKEVKEPTVYSSIIDKMDAYGYTLDDRDGKLFKEKYYELKSILDTDEINDEEYAKKLAELFVIDLLTIQNKVNKYDVGGLEYLYDQEREMFKNKVMDTLYDYVEDNSYGTREQELPIVDATTVTNIEKTTYKIEEKTLDAYEVSLEISYEKEMDYDKKVIITLVKEENKLYIVQYKSE